MNTHLYLLQAVQFVGNFVTHVASHRDLDVRAFVFLVTTFAASSSRPANSFSLTSPTILAIPIGTMAQQFPTPTSADKDVYAFLGNYFSEYSMQPFRIATESYGGIYESSISTLVLLLYWEIVLQSLSAVGVRW